MDSNKVEILGRHYSIVGIDDRAYLEELARFVDKQMREIAEATGTVDTLKVAILASLNITDRHFKSKRELDRAKEDMERKLTALSEQIQLALSH